MLGPTPAPLDAARDLADALARARDALGHRPLLTVLRPQVREEQSAISLAQWAAKGAHLLATDLLVEPGERLHLDVALGWPAVAVLYAAWWSGVVVQLPELDPHAPHAPTAPGVPADRAVVAVVQEGRAAPEGVEEVLWLGDALDGGPQGPVDGEAWTRACQAFPDQPPPPQAGPDAPALVVGDELLTHAQLLEQARALGLDGSLGVQLTAERQPAPPTGSGTLIAAAAVRPLLAGRPTALLRGVERDAARGERLRGWLEPG